MVFCRFSASRAETIPTVETAYCELLDALDEHLLHFPYLLGGRPSIADFGLMAPMYAHLARDPVPATIMKNRAANVFRWDQRMNLARIGDGEFPDCAETYPANDEIPATLEPVLRLVFKDWGPQLLADAARYEKWLKTNPAMPAGTLVSERGERNVHPSIGRVEYGWRGCVMQRSSSPHGLWHFGKAAAHARALSGDARSRFDALVQRTGGENVMDIRLTRPMMRARLRSGASVNTGSYCRVVSSRSRTATNRVRPSTSRARRRGWIVENRASQSGRPAMTLRLLFYPLVMLLCSVRPVASETIEDLARQVREAEGALADTMAKRDLKAFATFLDEEAVFFGGKGAIRGKSEVVERWKAFFDGPTAPFSWAPGIGRGAGLGSSRPQQRPGSQLGGQACRNVQFYLAARRGWPLARRVRQGLRCL